MKSELREHFDGSRTLSVTFTAMDLIRVPLDRFDLAMLREPTHGTADLLLDAELIARRLEQLDAEPRNSGP